MKPLRSLLLLGAMAMASVTHAADDLASIKQTGVFKIGTEGTYAPFTYHDKDGKLTGFDVEIGEAIAKRLGVKPEFVEGKWDGLIAGIDVNRYDAVINEVSITDARKAKYDFSEPYIASKAVLIVKDSEKDIKSFEDLKGKKSANTLTSNFGKLAEQYGAEVAPVQGFNDSIELVLSGRADATINDSLSFLDFKKHKPDAPVHVVASQADADHSGVLIRKGSPELLAAINKALDEMKADGTYLAIAKKYFGQDVSK